jgi:hypothetical protein
MLNPLTMGGPEMLGAELTDESREVLALSRAEPLPQEWDPLDRA